MRRKPSLVEFEGLLEAAQGGIALYRRGVNDFYLSDGFPRYYEQLEVVRQDLELIGMYDLCRDALTQAESLIRQGPEHDEEAENLILKAIRALMQASGSYETMRRRYRVSNDVPESQDPSD